MTAIMRSEGTGSQRTTTWGLFKDQNGLPHLWYGGEAWLICKKRIRPLIIQLLYQANGNLPTKSQVSEVINLIESEAIINGPTCFLYNRVGRLGDDIYYDLGAGDAVRVSPGCLAIEDTPALFRRYAHQQPQVIPEPGGDVTEIFEFINVAPQSRLLALIYLISCFVPDIAHPVMHTHGPQGSGKTLSCKFFKSLIDPSSIDTLIPPKDYAQQVQVLTHHYFCCFDNLSAVSNEFSDLLARASTGGGFSKRKLRTDDEDIIYNIKHCAAFNGIGQLIEKPDLMDRALLFQLERLTTDQRLSEEELLKKFEEAKPRILGGIFEVLALAAEIEPQVTVPAFSRMVDFTRWGYAIAMALGDMGLQFLQDYEANIHQQNTAAVNENVFVQCIIKFMADRDHWQGTVGEAYDSLRGIAGTDSADPAFPRHSNKVRRALNSVKVTLASQGIDFSIGNYHALQGVPIRFVKRCSASSASTTG